MKKKNSKVFLIICNVLLVLIMITAAWLYSGHISLSQSEVKKNDFIRTIDSMKRVSQNYLNGEQGYVKNWSRYISAHDMNMEEALDFLRNINTNTERYVHIVDMDSYEAYSTYFPRGKEKIDTYIPYKENAEGLPFRKIMEHMFEGSEEQFNLLGKYRLEETQSMAVGVGNRVSLCTENGKKDYLLLRIIPVEALRRSWVFPTEYSSAEVGIITRNGDYVVQSSSMRSQNYIEYIRGYNFQNDYNAGEKLRSTLKKNEHGILEYKNFRGTDCVWYYSSFGPNSELDIIGVVEKEALESTADAWYLVLLVCGMMMVLIIIDGAYLLSMNHRLKETARAAEQASKAKTQFLSAMSHDIRTPLNAVLGMMTLAEHKAGNPEYVKQCMEKGLQSGEHLLTLINDILDISKIESGNFTLNPETVSLTEMMRDLTNMQKQAVDKKNIELQADYDSLPYEYVYVDKMRLNQIYVNLFTNAVKYTPSGGKIILRLYEEKIPEDEKNIKVIFYIEDNGIGMSEEFQQHMYHNFSREIKTQVNRAQGTGLGLSIVKQMTELMRGSITCNSAPGKGTDFTISIVLPVAEAVKTNVSDRMNTKGMEHMHLLVAEDNELNWEIFKEIISEHEIVCDHAENGKECVEMLKAAPPDTYSAILMDVQMPVMNGYEATKEIRSWKDDERSGIPIVAMTADAFAEDVQTCIESGMNGHIAKPVNVKILFDYLEKIKNGQL